MAAQLNRPVYVMDPDTHQTVLLHPGTCPEPRLAVLVTNPAAWVDGKLPRIPKAKTDSGPSGDDQDDASGADSADSGDADPQSDEKTPDEGDDSDDTKPAARKTAAKKPARGRTAAAEGTGGQ